MQKCEFLLKEDYALIELDNTNGILSPRYPGRIFIPEHEHNNSSNAINNRTTTASHSIQHNQFNNNNNNNCNHYNNQTNAKNNITNSAKIISNSTSTNAANITDGIQNYLTFANMIPQHKPELEFTTSFPKISSSASNNSNPLPVTLSIPGSNMAGFYPVITKVDNHSKINSNMKIEINNSTENHHFNSTTNLNTTTTIYEDLYDGNRIRELITMAKYARCWQRFAVPVLMFRGKYICRSATISVMPETYGRKVVDYAYDCLNGTNYYNNERGNNGINNITAIEDGSDNSSDISDDSLMNQDQTSPFSYEEAIKSDIQLLDTLNVSSIVDLMVEKKKIKYFMA